MQTGIKPVFLELEATGSRFRSPKNSPALFKCIHFRRAKTKIGFKQILQTVFTDKTDAIIGLTRVAWK